jgi:hypothetical protein
MPRHALFVVVALSALLHLHRQRLVPALALDAGDRRRHCFAGGVDAAGANRPVRLGLKRALDRTPDLGRPAGDGLFRRC